MFMMYKNLLIFLVKTQRTKVHKGKVKRNLYKHQDNKHKHINSKTRISSNVKLTPFIEMIFFQVTINSNVCILSSRFDRRTFRFKDLFRFMEPTGCLKEKEDYSLYIFAPDNK